MTETCQHTALPFGGGYLSGSVLRRRAMVLMPTRSSTRQLKICATTGAVTGSRISRVLVQQLASVLRERIRSGAISRRVPSVKSLVQEFGIAQGTAERALGVLREEGLIRSVIGRGHFVVPANERPRTG